MECDVGGAGHRVQIPRLGTGPAVSNVPTEPFGAQISYFSYKNTDWTVQELSLSDETCVRILPNIEYLIYVA